MSNTNGSAATLALARAFQDAIAEAVAPLETKVDSNTKMLAGRIDQLAQRMPEQA